MNEYVSSQTADGMLPGRSALPCGCLALNPSGGQGSPCVFASVSFRFSCSRSRCRCSRRCCRVSLAAAASIAA